MPELDDLVAEFSGLDNDTIGKVAEEKRNAFEKVSAKFCGIKGASNEEFALALREYTAATIAAVKANRKEVR